MNEIATAPFVLRFLLRRRSMLVGTSSATIDRTVFARAVGRQTTDSTLNPTRLPLG